MQKVTRLACVVLALHATAVVGGSVHKQMSRMPSVSPDEAATLLSRGGDLLVRQGYRPVSERPLRLKMLMHLATYQAPGCGRAHWLFAAPVGENTRQYFVSQGRGEFIFRYHYGDSVSDFPSTLQRRLQELVLKLKHAVGWGHMPAGHFLMLAIPAECAQAAVDLRPAYQGL